MNLPYKPTSNSHTGLWETGRFVSSWKISHILQERKCIRERIGFWDFQVLINFILSWINNCHPVVAKSKSLLIAFSVSPPSVSFVQQKQSLQINIYPLLPFKKSSNISIIFLSFFFNQVFVFLSVTRTENATILFNG